MVEITLQAPARGKPPKHLLDLPRQDRRDLVRDLGLPPYRADQASRHMLVRYSEDVASWSDISDTDKESLQRVIPRLLEGVRELTCDEGATVKYVHRLHDGSLVESVLMNYPDRTTMCISSQAGCGMNCPFCATGQAGLTRNLSPMEIVSQVLSGARAVAEGRAPGRRVSNIVFMGMGEPLANYSSVVQALRRLTEPPPAGMGMSARGITVSTVGLVPGIRNLAELGIPVTLAVSLHAPDDELRDELVPINNRWKVNEVLEAAWNYAEKTKRRVSIEYALIKDINDQAERARHLGTLLSGRLAHVNVIPLNPTPGSKWTASDAGTQRAFVHTLKESGVAVTVRDTRGREIAGACGQLAALEGDK